MSDELIDITDQIVPDDNASSYFNEADSIEVYDLCCFLLEEFVEQHPSLIASPDFHEILDEDVRQLLHAHFDADVLFTEEAEDELDDILEYAKETFFEHHHYPHRAYPTTLLLKEPDHEFVTNQLNYLRQKPQPAQKTKEWYTFRHNLITASNAYKAFENQTIQNQLIYEKCKPLSAATAASPTDSDSDGDGGGGDNLRTITMVNTNTTLHWGQKYEPLSVKIYEYLFNTKIEDFGCLQHDVYPFLGASPDGINVDPLSPRYGRMLEIKNIVNRDIDGNPKKEYWIQMQLQMEVCGFDECDFLETRFTEYPDYASFRDDDVEPYQKGLILHFHNVQQGTPLYVYKPLDIVHLSDITQWQEQMVDTHSSASCTYITTYYWKLAEMNCALVCRNQKWFEHHVPQLQTIWTIIEQERASNRYEHRAPTQKRKKEEPAAETTISNKCWLFTNIVKKEAESDCIEPVKMQTQTTLNNCWLFQKKDAEDV